MTDYVWNFTLTYSGASEGWIIRDEPLPVNLIGDRGIFGGGYDDSNSNVIDYVTILSTGNATDFGNLTVARGIFDATSNSAL